MQPNLYRVRFDEHRLTALEIAPSEAAKALDQGQAVLVATAAELCGLARRHQRALFVITSQVSHRSTRVGDPAKVA